MCKRTFWAEARKSGRKDFSWLAVKAGFMILRMRAWSASAHALAKVPSWCNLHEHSPCANRMPGPVISRVTCRATAVLGKWYPDLWKMYWRAFGSAIPSESS